MAESGVLSSISSMPGRAALQTAFLWAGAGARSLGCVRKGWESLLLAPVNVEPALPTCLSSYLTANPWGHWDPLSEEVPTYIGLFSEADLTQEWGSFPKPANQGYHSFSWSPLYLFRNKHLTRMLSRMFARAEALALEVLGFANGQGNLGCSRAGMEGKGVGVARTWRCMGMLVGS